MPNVPKNIARIQRLSNAVAATQEMEIAWHFTGRATGQAAIKRELVAAYEDYVSHHAKRERPAA
jgi:hypothetical protein